MVVFDLFLPKTEEEKEIPIVNNLKEYYKKFEMWIRAGGGGGVCQMWKILKFYNIIIKSANVDKEEGKTLIHKMWIKKGVFLTPPKEYSLMYSLKPSII